MKTPNSLFLVGSVVLNYLEVTDAFANLMEAMVSPSREIHNHINVEDNSRWFSKPSQEPWIRTLVWTA